MTFFNIFSKKPSENKKQKIIIDNREKNSLLPAELAKLGLEIEFQHLEVGDYLINKTIVERKTLSDLKSSIINKRIFSQLQEIKQYPSFLLLVEGISDEDIYSGPIHENALRGFLLSAALDYQVPIIFTQNEKDSAKYLFLLSKREPNKILSLRAGKIALTDQEKAQFILEGFSGIGPSTAKKLISDFKSLKNIFSASKEELTKSIGKKADSLYSLINQDI